MVVTEDQSPLSYRPQRRVRSARSHSPRFSSETEPARERIRKPSPQVLSQRLVMPVHKIFEPPMLFTQVDLDQASTEFAQLQSAYLSEKVIMEKMAAEQAEHRQVLSEITEEAAMYQKLWQTGQQQHEVDRLSLNIGHIVHSMNE